MASNGGDLFKGFILGTLTGLAVGILFAPKSGKDMREDLLEEGDDLIDKAKKELDKLKKDLADLRVKISETIDRGKGVFEHGQTAEERDFEKELNNLDDEVTAENEEKEKKTAARKKSAIKKES